MSLVQHMPYRRAGIKSHPELATGEKVNGARVEKRAQVAGLDEHGADEDETAKPDPHVIEVTEERAVVEKVDRPGERVRVSRRTELVDETVRENLTSLEVDVAHVLVDRELSPGEEVPVTRREGDVTIVPVLEEVLVVEKRLILREEIHIRESLTREEVEMPVSLRRQRATVEREEPSEAAPVTPTDNR